jgi:hypothetical protein
LPLGVRYRCHVTDEAQSHPPFLRRIREGGRRNEPAGEPGSVEPLPPTGAADDPPDAAPLREGLHRALLEVGERVDEIIAGAERAAEDVRRRAQADADRYLAERRRRADTLEAERNRRFQEALEALQSGVARIEDESERVVRSVEETIRRADQPESEPPEETPAVAPAGPAPVAYPGRGRSEPDVDENADPRVSMLIRATQLAVQGHERAEIEQTLETEFAGIDAEQVVNQVLGRR